MRILLVVNESVMHERMGVMCLSASLKRAGFTVRLAVVERERLSGMRSLLDEYRLVPVLR